MSSPAQPSGRPLASWLAISLTVGALLAAAAVIGRPAAAAVDGVAGWLPPDGHRTRLAAAGAIAATEWSRPTAFSLAQSGAPEFWVWVQITETGWDTATYLRAMTHRLDQAGGSQGRSEALWALDDTGARQVLDLTADGESIVFEPGRLDLPAGLKAGDAWTSQGELARRMPGEEWAVHAYRAEYRALAAGDPALAGRGCVVIVREFSFADQTRPGEQTWCPGTGVVAGSDADTRWAPGGPAPAPTVADPAPFDWSRVDDVEFTTSTVNQVGTGVAQVSPVVAPGIQPDGRLVFTNQVLPDVLTLDVTSDPAPVAWHARPGATPTTGGTFGGLTVVATAARTVVGYGPDGQWLWEAALSDITRVPPVRLGSSVVLVTLDGRVTALDLATGAQAWHADLAGEIRRPPVVVGDRLIVGDQTGALTCLDAAGTEQWVIDAGVALSLAASPGAEPVVVVGRDGSPVLQAYRVSDGARVWRVRHYDDARDIVAVADRFVLRDGDRTTALDAATGATAWTWTGARTWAAAGGGERVLLLTDTDLVLLDADGRQLRSWPHRLGDITQSASFLAAGEGAVVAYGPVAVTVGRLP